jgi:hypothetical protein
VDCVLVSQYVFAGHVTPAPQMHSLAPILTEPFVGEQAEGAYAFTKHLSASATDAGEALQYFVAAHNGPSASFVAHMQAAVCCELSVWFVFAH